MSERSLVCLMSDSSLYLNFDFVQEIQLKVSNYDSVFPLFCISSRSAKVTPVAQSRTPAPNAITPGRTLAYELSKEEASS